MMCEATFIDDEAELSHECDRDKEHEEAHRCFCGMEF